MPQINIRGTKDNSNDPTYRYKMDKLDLKIIKNKTTITNIDKVAKDLDRSPQIIVDYFKKQFGISIMYSKKVAVCSKVLTVNELEKKLFEFIESNVLCKKCKNPETVIVQNKKKEIMTCKSCSAESTIE